MKIGVIGYYGFGNLGDELLLSSFLQNMKEIAPSAEINVYSKYPQDTKKTYNVNAIPRNNFLAVKDYDILVFGGGGLIQNSTSIKSLMFYLLHVVLAKFYRKKVVLLAQGIGPLSGRFAKIISRIIINMTDLITVRDESSKSLLKSIGVTKPIEVTADLVFSLEFPIEKNSSHAIGISVRSANVASDKYRLEISKFIKYLMGMSKSVVLLCLKEEDILEAKKINELLANQVDIVSPMQVVNKMRSLDVIIGMRLHSLILATMMKIPFVALSYDPKVASFAAMANQRYIDLKDLSFQSLSTYYNDINLDKRSIIDRLAESSKKLTAKSKMNFEILKRFMYLLDEQYVLGIKIHSVTMNESVKIVENLIKRGNPSVIFTPNPEIIMTSQKDQVLSDIINSADLCIPDGAGLVWACRHILKNNIKERVAGIDLMNELLWLASIKGYRVFLLGGGFNAAEYAAKNIKQKYKNINIVGTHHGYFSDAGESELIANISKLKPDLLFVGLGQGKQEKWIFQNKKALNVPVCMAIGGSFDVWAGKVKRAPKIYQKMQIEWIYRTLKEPWRLARIRVLPIFLWCVWKSRHFR